MTKLKKVGVLMLTMIMIIAMTTGSAVLAASNAITVKAYPGVKIVYNGQTLTDANQPYIINDTTYIPLRMLMNSFGKMISWDAANRQVTITSGLAESQKEAELINLRKKNAELENTIKTLNDQLSYQREREDDVSLSDLRSTLNSYFKDAGEEYFDDDRLDFTFSLRGDEDDLEYTIEADFSDSREYDDLADTRTSDIEDFLDKVESKIESELDRTDYEDADITGELEDADYSRYYVKYNGRTYSYSWEDDGDDINLSSLEKTLRSEFDDAGDKYFDDSRLDFTFSVSGDDDELEFTIRMDFDDSRQYDDLEDINSFDVRSFIGAVKTEISSEIRGTSYKDADINGKLIDNDNSRLYIEYEDGRFEFSFD